MHIAEQWLALLPHGKKVLGSILVLAPFSVDFACSLHVCVGSLQVFQLPPPIPNTSNW